jgi:hypothetical protein
MSGLKLVLVILAVFAIALTVPLSGATSVSRCTPQVGIEGCVSAGTAPAPYGCASATFGFVEVGKCTPLVL